MDNNEKLTKAMSPAAVWALAVGSIIGFGCFMLPPEFLQKAGPLGFILGIVCGAAIMLIIGKNIGYMVEHFPVAGGQFTYATALFGKSHGFVCGWMLILGYISLIALNATALALLAEYLFPTVFKQCYLYTIAGWNVYLPEVLLACAAIFVFAFFNLRGGKIAGGLQVAMVLMLIAGVVMILIGTVLSPNTKLSNLTPLLAPGKSVFSCVFAILAMTPFLFVGFDTVPQSAEEFSFSPKRTFSLIMAAIFSGAAIYLTVTLCTGAVWPWQDMVAVQYTWATGTAMNYAVGTVGVCFLALAISMGILTGMNGFYMASSRLMLAMAREEMLPRWFGHIDAKYKTPSHAILAALIVSLIAPWFGRRVLTWVVDMCSCGTIIGYLYTSAAALKLSRAHFGEGKAKISTVIFAAVGVVLSACILLLLVIPGMPGAMSKETWIAFAVWVVIGAVFYFTVVKKSLKETR